MSSWGRGGVGVDSFICPLRKFGQRGGGGSVWMQTGKLFCNFGEKC